MKHIYKLRDKGFIQMDSYCENHETNFSDVLANFFVISMILGIAVITAGALVGIDITNPQSNYTQQSK